MEQDKNYKLKKRKKSGIAIGLASIIMLGSFVKLVIPSHNNSNDQNEPGISYTIDIARDDEFTTYDYDVAYIPISISNSDANEFSSYLDSAPQYTISEYYCVEDALEHYRNTGVQKGNNTEVLNESGKIDENKLYNVVVKNNDACMSNGKNSINTFYKELDESGIRKICGIISDVVNNSCSESEIRKIADTLSELKVFKRTGSASNAYVSSELTFVYNPSMSSMYSNVQKIKDSETNEEDVINSVLVHETEHLIQYLSNDRNDENGLESGFCRMYNMPNMPEKVPVDSLYYSWILEGSAELKMSEYLNMEPGTYAKKIAYIDSFNLSRILQTNSTDNYLENLAYSSSIDEVFDKLNIHEEKDKAEFMKLMYSIELTQASSDSFWKYYQEKTGSNLSDDEITKTKMLVREDAVINLSKTYYENLISSVQAGEINDLNTLFFMMRIWEIDAYSHLEYNKDSVSLECAKRYLQWNSNVQGEIFQLVGKNVNLSEDELKEMYNEYNLYEDDNGNIKPNCNLNGLKENQKDFILSKINKYTARGFSKTSDMITYIDNQAGTKK